MFAETKSRTQSWEGVFTSAAPVEEAFAWMDAAFLALGFKREFTPEAYFYARRGQRIELKFEGSPSGSLVTALGEKGSLSEEQRQTLEKAAQRTLTPENCRGFVTPAAPWLQPSELIPPYPRKAKERQKPVGASPKEPRKVSMNVASSMLETSFHTSDGHEMDLMRLRAFAHAHEWREVEAPQGEARFVRGDTVIPAGQEGYFALPAILTAHFLPETGEVVLRHFLWGDDAPGILSTCAEETSALRSYIKASIRPDGFVRSVGSSAGLRVPPAAVSLLLMSLATLIGELSSFGTAQTRGAAWVLVIVVWVVYIWSFSNGAGFKKYSKDPLPLRPEAYRPELVSPPGRAPEWAEVEFQNMEARLERARQLATLQVIL